MIYISE